MDLELLYSNKISLEQLKKNDEIQKRIDGKRVDVLSNYKLGQFQPELSGQTKGQDFLYQQNLYYNQYGRDIPLKPQSATPYTFPQIIRPLTQQYDDKYSSLLASRDEREVEVSGYVYKVKDLPPIPKKIIS
jgi:hypothetical protein